MTTWRWWGILSVIGAAALWGTTGTVQSLMPAEPNPLAVGALRLLFGATSLILLALTNSACRSAVTNLPWGGITFAGVAIGGYNLLFFLAVTKAGVGIGTAIAIGSAPIWTTAYEIMVRREWPSRLRAVGQIISIIGVALLGLSSGGSSGILIGFVLALGAGACYAAYSLATSRIGHRAPSTVIAAATFSVAALVTAPILFLVPLTWLVGAQNWIALIFLGVGATGISYALYTWGLTKVAASTAVTLALAEPVTAWLLATFMIGEVVTVQSAFAVTLILTGLVIVTIFPKTASS